MRALDQRATRALAALGSSGPAPPWKQRGRGQGRGRGGAARLETNRTKGWPETPIANLFRAGGGRARVGFLADSDTHRPLVWANLRCRGCRARVRRLARDAGPSEPLYASSSLRPQANLPMRADHVVW